MAEKLIVPATAAAAVALKDRKTAFLAGGTEINRLGTSVKADRLVRIGRIQEIDGVREESHCIRIGATCTFQEAMDCPIVPEFIKEGCRFMASRTKRNMATIGGNVALLRDDSYICPTLIAAGAGLEILEPGGKKIVMPIEDYIRKHDEYKNALIMSILIKKGVKDVCSKRYANTAESHAVLTVSVGMVEGKLRVAAAIKNSGLFPLKKLADALNAKDMTEEEIVAWAKECQAAEIHDDLYGSEAYKRYLLGVTVSELVKAVKGGAR